MSRRLLVLLVGLALAVGIVLTAARGALPDPPLLVILPDSTEVGADRIDYDLDGRTVRVFRDRLFVDDFED